MYAIKTAVPDSQAHAWHFQAQKTMYGGKHIRTGDTVFVFASENEGGKGLVAWGVVTAAEATPRRAGIERQTPRVSIRVECKGSAKRPLGRKELGGFNDWSQADPQTELNFKFYRQATNKIVALSAEAAAFLRGCF